MAKRRMRRTTQNANDRRSTADSLTDTARDISASNLHRRLALKPGQSSSKAPPARINVPRSRFPRLSLSMEWSIL